MSTTGHSGRVRSFDELDRYLGGTGGVGFLDRRYLGVGDEESVAAIKAYAKEVLRGLLDKRRNPRGFMDRILNGIGYRDALIAKYGILMVAARRRLDKENPHSLISSIEEKIGSQVRGLIDRLSLPEWVYWPWMAVFSYPSPEVGECHPWIARFRTVLGADAVRAARRVRGLMDLYRSAALRWIEDRIGRENVENLKSLIGRLQRIHFWSERDELEEEEDLALTNMVVDNFCTHWDEHGTLKDIRDCPNVRKFLEPRRLRKMRLAIYVLLDDYLSQGRRLRRLVWKGKAERG
ncbi:MAG: hypothetical protein QW569_04930 [Candidatus Bathyarchaeia archaeon]|nr:hypothetical protein [Candidatus Bathyarchaeota archaeon]